MNFDCIFCHVTTEASQSMVNSPTPTFRCHGCNTFYTTFRDGRLIDYLIRYQRSPGLVYYLVFDVLNNKFIVEKFGIPAWIGNNPILTLDFLPNINPDNMEEKLQTLLTFL